MYPCSYMIISFAEPCSGMPCSGGSSCAVDGSSEECICPEGQQCEGVCDGVSTGELMDENQTCTGEPVEVLVTDSALSYMYCRSVVQS